MPITHCIFDLDGLILDTETLYTKNTQRIFDNYGVEFKREWKIKIMGNSPKDAAEFLINESKIDLKPDEFSKQLYELMEIDFRNCQVLPGVYSVLNELKKRNILMCIATGSSQDTFNSKMSNHDDLKPYFSHVVCGGSDPKVQRSKPFPDIFIEAMNRFNDSNIIRDQILVFEDSRNGVEAALSAGMKVIWVPDISDVDGCSDGVIRLGSLSEFDFAVLDK